MPFILQEVNSDHDFEGIAEVVYKAFEDPFDPFIRLMYPIHGNGPTARADSLNESTKRCIMSHNTDPSSNWIKLVDTDTKCIAAVGRWQIHLTNPYSEPPSEPIQATWWPEGEGRRFASSVIQLQMDHRVKWQSMPHLFLNLTATLPDYRRKGAGELIMRWVTKKADELGLNCFVEASPLGKPLYLKHGFRVVEERELRPINPEQSEEWTRLARELLPGVGFFMWRPIGGVYEDGKTVRPWETRS